MYYVLGNIAQRVTLLLIPSSAVADINTYKLALCQLLFRNIKIPIIPFVRSFLEVMELIWVRSIVVEN